VAAGGGVLGVAAGAEGAAAGGGDVFDELAHADAIIAPAARTTATNRPAVNRAAGLGPDEWVVICEPLKPSS
jgi:sarcosine oxidase gamma subunit